MLPLACTAVSIQVLLRSDFDPFHLLNDEWAQSQLEKAWPWMQLRRRKPLSTAWQLRMHSCRQRREECALEIKPKNEMETGTTLRLVSLDDSPGFCRSAPPIGLLWRESPSHRHDPRKSVKAGCTPGSGGWAPVNRLRPSGIPQPQQEISMNTQKPAQNHIERLLAGTLVPRSSFMPFVGRYLCRFRKGLSHCCYWSVRASTRTTSQLLPVFRLSLFSFPVSFICSACSAFHTCSAMHNPAHLVVITSQHISFTLNFGPRRIVSLPRVAGWYLFYLCSHPVLQHEQCCFHQCSCLPSN